MAALRVCEMTGRRRLIGAAIGLLGLIHWGASAADKVVFLPLRENVLAYAVGADAFSVAGTYYRGGAFFWMPTSSDTRLAGTGAAAISSDGRTIIGSALDSNGFENAAIWTAANQQWRLLGSVVPSAAACDRLLSNSFGATDDGNVVVGLAWNGCSYARAFRWEASTGMVDLGSTNGGSTRANNISNDGKVVIGWRTHQTGFRQAVKWVGLKEELIVGSGELLGEARGINADGSIIVGGNCDPFAIVNQAAWVWTPETGVKCYPVQHPDSLPRDIPYAPIMFDLSDDGSVIVGAYTFGLDSEALLWIDGRVYFLKEYLAQRGLPNAFHRWINTGFLTAVSRDGRTLVGYGAGPTGFTGYVVILPEHAR